MGDGGVVGDGVLCAYVWAMVGDGGRWWVEL